MHCAVPTTVLNFPATHSAHGPLFGPDAPALQMQSACASLPAAESEFGGHGLHTVSALAPTVVEYLPAIQFEHAAFPAEGLNFPATHCVQGPPLAPDEPALQVQAVLIELPAGEFEKGVHPVHVDSAICATPIENFPAPQSVHAASPAATLYFPVAQPMQVPPFRPVYPGLQVQSSIESLSAGELEFAAHVRQAVLPAAEYRPAAQSAHDPAPSKALNLPAGQIAHAPLEPEYPFRQMQWASVELPTATVTEFAPHATHVDGFVAPSPVEYVCRPHAWQFAEPSADLYFPAVQIWQMGPDPGGGGVHGPPAGPV